MVSVERQGEDYIFTTKGDANALSDYYPAAGGKVLGKVIFISHPLGAAVNFLSSPAAFILLIMVPLLIIFISNFARTVISARKLLREEEEAAVREAMEELERRKKEKNIGQK